MSLTNLITEARIGWLELVEGCFNWRIWHLMGSRELRSRYTRSRIGQFWVTLSMGISVVTIGVVWSLLWNISASSMLPHLAASLIVWQFISGILTDATTIFATNRHYLLSQRLACSTLIFSMLYRNLLTLAHNFLIIVIVFIVFRQPITLQLLLIIPGIILTSITAVWLGYIVGILSARFRDINYALQSFIQLFFYITPVIWKPDFIGEQYRWLQLFNPFSIFLSIIRDPITGSGFSAANWLLAITITFGGLMTSLFFIGKYRRRILFWI